MSKIIFNSIWGALVAIALALITFFMIYFKMEYSSFMATLIVTMGYGFLNILLMLVRVIYKYEIKRLTAAIYATIVAVGVIGYYVLKYIGHYDEGKIIYWIVYAGILILAIPIMTFINYRLLDQKLVMTKGKK